MKALITRLTYLASRGFFKPERAFSVVEAHAPLFDIAFLVLVSAGGMAAVGAMEGQAVRSVTGYVMALGLMALYGLTTSITAYLFSGRLRVLPTILSFLLSGIIAFCVSVVPVAIIRIVDSGHKTQVSDTIITMGPWVYCAFLAYFAVFKIHKTVPGRAIAFLGLGALPIIFIVVALRAYGSDIPIGFEY